MLALLPLPVLVEHLAYPKHLPTPQERILAALQQTWAEYKAEEEASLVRLDGEMGAATAGLGGTLVPADDLAEAFGEGYGDMSEALALMQDELSQSANKAAVEIAALMVLVPLSLSGDTLPNPDTAWGLAQEWQVTQSPLIAVDLSIPMPTQDVSRKLAELWVPSAAAASAMIGDLGPGHRLVSLVCYMWTCRHYVAFCRRQRDPVRCVFFNDLPALTSGAPREVEWRAVPHMCGTYFLTPKLALYESIAVADSVSRDAMASVA